MKFLTDFAYRNLHGFARFPGDSTAIYASTLTNTVDMTVICADSFCGMNLKGPRTVEKSGGQTRPWRVRERKPITGVCGQSPQRGSRGQSPRWGVRGAKPPAKKNYHGNVMVYHRYTMVYHGVPWYTVVHKYWFTMVYHSTACITMVAIPVTTVTPW